MAEARGEGAMGVEGAGEAFVVLAPRLVTCDPARASARDPLGVIEDGAVLALGARIASVGERDRVLEEARGLGARLVRAGGVVTPGLVDAHTHAPWVGSRDAEYAVRMAGGSYEEIAAAGGGIVSTMRAVREVARAGSRGALEAALEGRLGRMASLGVTTVEAKSGYGLDLESERAQLEAIGAAARRADLPRVVPTYLALHALPPEAGGDRDAYAERVVSEFLPAIASANLARFVDAYVDRGAFSCEHAAPLFARASALGLGVRVHAGQFEDVGAASLAATFGAASADHLEHLDEEGALALARGGVRAVLLPLASFTLAQAPPPVARLRRAGVRLVVASDANPGTAPTESLPLALALAVRLYGLSVAEALLGATREAAASLGLGAETGRLSPGLRADLALWDLPHENAIVQPWGVSKARCVLRDGLAIHGDPARLG